MKTQPIAEQRDATLRELGASFETLAKDVGTEFVRLYGVVPDECLTKDGVHPDVARNPAIAAKMLEKLVQDLLPAE